MWIDPAMPLARFEWLLIGLTACWLGGFLLIVRLLGLGWADFLEFLGEVRQWAAGLFAPDPAAAPDVPAARVARELRLVEPRTAVLARPSSCQALAPTAFPCMAIDLAPDLDLWLMEHGIVPAESRR